MDTPNSFDKRVIDILLAQKTFAFSQISNLEEIHSTLFIRDQYPDIVSLIKNRAWEEIKSINNKVEGFNEYLNILRFYAQDNKTYVITIYDNDELWQDPQYIDIFPIE